MTRHIWRAADTGIMLWEPAVAATTTIAPQKPHEQKQSHTVTETDTQGKRSPVILPFAIPEQVLTARKQT
jgi:hypothetical protein